MGPALSDTDMYMSLDFATYTPIGEEASPSSANVTQHSKGPRCPQVLVADQLRILSSSPVHAHRIVAAQAAGRKSLPRHYLDGQII